MFMRTTSKKNDVSLEKATAAITGFGTGLLPENNRKERGLN